MRIFNALLPLFFLLLAFSTSAQFTDDFSDGDFDTNPTWSGDTGVFDINPGLEFWLNAPAITAESYASLPSQAIENATWEFFVRLDFNPSSSNNAMIYLVSDQPVLTSPLNGYYVRIGGQDDEISLYRQSGGSVTELIDGIDNTVDSDPVEVRIRVTRDVTGNWELLRDTAGGTNFVSEGTVFDNLHFISSHFGVRCDYTSTRSDKFFFDDFVVTGQPYTDLIPPVIDSVVVVSSNNLDVYFNEFVDAASAQNAANYSVNNSVGTPSSATIDLVDSSLVHLNFATAFPNGTNSILSTSNVADTAGNIMAAALDTFLFFNAVPAQFGDVIITEIYADFSPSNGLPAAEYVELYNASTNIYNLENWLFSDPSVTGDLNNYFLFPGEYVVICENNNAPLFSAFPNVLGIGPFPTLNNGGDVLTLTDNQGTLIDQVDYSSTWYDDPNKDDGGWSLELINPQAVCVAGSENWTASNAAIGGTPGTQNSVFNLAPDTDAPELIGLTINTQTEIVVQFNEAMDSLSLVNGSYTFNPNLPIASIDPLPPTFEDVILTLGAPIDSSLTYTLTVGGVTDCPGNVIGTANTFTFAIGASAQPNDIIFTEIFPDFTPVVGLPEAEFVELHNRSGELINLQNYEFEDAAGTDATLPAYFIQPGEYVILCHETDTSDFNAFGATIGISPFPSLNSGQETIRLIDSNGVVINEVSYTSEWYNDLVKDNGGWTLELINPQAACIEGSGNWTASVDPAGGTPGTQNSVFSTVPDTDAPELIDVNVIDSNRIELIFNESMDSVSLMNANYAIVPALPIDSILPIARTFEHTELVFGQNIDSTISYTIAVTGATDCPGNAIGAANNGTFAIGAAPAFGEVLITEIMADYSPSVQLPEQEYIELYNNSTKLFNLQDWEFSDFSSTVELDNYLFAPGDYLILCHRDDTALFSPLGNTLGVASFPGLNNSGDNLSLRDRNGNLVDQVNYALAWYGDPTKDDGGWSLEMINPQANCRNTPGNWAASVDPLGGTPGAQNSVNDLTPDTQAPSLVSIEVTGSDELLITFDEAMDSASVVGAVYTFTPALNIDFVEALPPLYDQALIQLTGILDSTLVYTLEVTNATDCPGNTIGTNNFMDFAIGVEPALGELILNELFPDPDTSKNANMPNAEFMELYNISGSAIRLTDCLISDGSNTAVLPNAVIFPDEYVILTEEDDAPLYTSFGRVIPVDGLPSQNNTGEFISLSDPNGVFLDGLDYTQETYQDDTRADGGFTLERINPDEPCGGEINWRANLNSDGGTPGAINSVFDPNFGSLTPEVVSVQATENNQVEIVFSKTMTQNSLLNGTYIFSPNLNILFVNPVGPSFRSVTIETDSNSIQPGVSYTVEVQNVLDCAGNPIGSDNMGEFALPEPGTVIINEVLFNPIGSGSDYVELYNRSNVTVNLKDWAFAYENNAGNTSYRTITERNETIAPGEFRLITEDIGNIQFRYPNATELNFPNVPIETDLPSFPNSSGEVHLVSNLRTTVDQFNYSEDLHFQLLDDVEGVSLERINYDRPTDDRTNWHSASETVGFGTPGYENSQYQEQGYISQEITIPDNTFSPDGDGNEDNLNINYAFNEPGYVANIRIYDSEGREIRQLVNNQLLGASGTFSWDGITDDNEKARVGLYVIFIEVFDLEGDKKLFKETCVLATRF